MSRRSSRLLLLLLVLGAPFASSAAACGPDLPPPSHDPPEEVLLSIVPEAPPDGVPPVAWLRLRGAARAGILPEDVVLAQGKLGPTSLEDLSVGTPSSSLAERLVPATGYVEGDDVWLLPDAVLHDGVHTLGVPSTTETWPLVVRADGARVLDRVWPPIGRAASSWLTVFCGDEDLSAVDELVRFAPAGPTGRVRRGTPHGGARRCVVFTPDAMVGGPSVAHPPPAIDAGDRLYLDPSPLGLSPGEPVPTDVVACELDEVPFGPGCARVLDDRAVVRTPEAPVFWAIHGAGVDASATTSEGEALVVRGLTPDSTAALALEWLGLPGVWSARHVLVRTSPPMPHPVLTEVYADAVGPEPASEWVELVNDGVAPLSLGGWVLADVGGETVLPEALVPPGRYALIVGEDFVGDGEYDAPPAPDAVVVRVPRVGKNGLGNQGEPLKLVRPDGEVVSRAPADPAPRSGKSVARRSPATEDGDPAAFFLADPPTPGAPNVPPGAGGTP